jgi:glycosyltransferase involved in cell wall biosynthesis
MTFPTFMLVSNNAGSLINFRSSLIRRIVGAGWIVLAVAPDHTDETREALSRIGAKPLDAPMSRTSLNPLLDIRTLYSLWNLIRQVRPTVCFSYSAKPLIYGTLAAKIARVDTRVAMIEGFGFVFGSDEVTSFRRRALRRLVTSLYRLSLRQATLVLVLNSEDRVDAINLRLAAPDKIKNIGGIGVDLNEWQMTAPFIRPITFTFVGRMLAEKGVGQFVEAARVIKKAHPTVRFILVGGADENPNSLTTQRLEEWVREGIVEWAGHSDVRPWLEQTSVFVLPSYYREGVPRSTQEAMAMGRPVITTDSVGCRDTVVQGFNGYLVPPRDVSALIAAMQQFLSDPKSIGVMGTNSRILAEERFDSKKCDQLLINLMQIRK